MTFYDTPGISKNKETSRYFVTKGWEVLSDCNKVLFIVDSVKMIDDYVRESLRRLNKI